MIDKEKTDFLRKRIQQEKTVPESNEQPKGSSALSFLLIFTARFFAFYGTQWLILNKLTMQPFSMLETVIVFFGLTAIFAKK